MRAADDVANQAIASGPWQENQHAHLTHLMLLGGSVGAGIGSLLGVANPLKLAGAASVMSFFSLSPRAQYVDSALTAYTALQETEDPMHVPLARTIARNVKNNLDAHAACTALGQFLALALITPDITSAFPENAHKQALATMITSAVGSYVGSLAYHAGKTLADRCWTERIPPREHRDRQAFIMLIDH